MSSITAKTPKLTKREIRMMKSTVVAKTGMVKSPRKYSRMNVPTLAQMMPTSVSVPALELYLRIMSSRKVRKRAKKASDYTIYLAFTIV